MKKDVLQMPEIWLSKERLLSNSTPMFLTDDGESTEQPSSVIMGVLGPIINTCFFSEFRSKKLLVIHFFISTMHSMQLCKFLNLVCFTGS